MNGILHDAALDRDGTPVAGVFSTQVDTLAEAARWLVEDRDAAYRLGARAREVAKERFGLDRFLTGWDRILEEETCASR